MYKKVEYNHVCECCGQSFVAHNKGKRFCSRKCKDVSYKQSKGQDSRLEPRRLTCTICGREFETFNPTKKTCSSSCSKEQERIWEKNYKRKGPTGLSWEEYVQQRREGADRRAKTKEVERLWIRKAHTVERKCEYCGATFFCFDWESTKTCSKECSKKRKNSSKDKRIPPHAMIDKDISIKKLFLRDKGICYLCGKECSFDDWKTSRSGYKYPGDSYPEIEHVIPLSRGGLHSWDNVRLACRRCNGLKGDSIVIVDPMSKQLAYSVKSNGGAKKTIQMTKDGDVIHVWDSTAQIKRELGLNDKTIQNACRGEMKTAFGFVWKYA